MYLSGTVPREHSTNDPIALTIEKTRIIYTNIRRQTNRPGRESPHKFLEEDVKLSYCNDSYVLYK